MVVGYHPQNTNYHLSNEVSSKTANAVNQLMDNKTTKLEKRKKGE